MLLIFLLNRFSIFTISLSIILSASTTVGNTINQSENEIPDPLLWAQEVDDLSAIEKGAAFIHALTVWSEREQSQRRWLKIGDGFSELSFIRFFPQSGFLFLSRFAGSQTAANKASPTQFMFSSPANGMLLEQGTHLSLTVWQKNVRVRLGTWTVDKQEINYSSEVLAFLRDELGYDAVVLDNKGPLLLVGFILRPKEDGQGLLFAGSEQHFKIDPKNNKFGALLQLLKVNRGYGIMEILTGEFKVAKAGGIKVPIGSKVLMGSAHDPVK